MRPMKSISSAVLALALGLSPAGQAAEPQMMPAHYQEKAQEKAAAPCPVSAAWFDDKAPEAPFKFADDNCAFHQWAVQEFLYLVQKEPNGLLRFLNMASPHALFLYQGAGPAPYPGSPHTQFKLGAGAARLRATAKANDAPRVVFLPRTLKTENTTFNADTQAGSNAVLVDQAGQVVYYTSQINKVYYDFIRSNGYYKKDAYSKIPPETAFPIGAVELKSSWRIAIKDGKEYMNAGTRAKYYTVEGEVCKDKDCKSLVPATMALVGFHVVGRVAQHPEMVWATFEHYNNAPDCNRTPFPPGEISFYKSNFDCGKGPFWDKCNQIRKDDWTTPSEICRAHPDGEPGTGDTIANIQSIRLSYFNLVPDKSVWKNYSYISSVWTVPQDPAKPALINLEDKNIRGSKKASNTTMESFTQEKNCLHCHTYQPTQITGNCFPSGNKNIYLSHLVGLICQQKPQ